MNQLWLKCELQLYPFGLIMRGISDKAVGPLANRYKYNGKELQSTEFSDGSGLEEYDYGARYQDPQLGRWFGVDPKADEYYGVSPFSFALNNPVKYIDPNGESVYLMIWATSDGKIGHAAIAIDNYREKKDKDGHTVHDKNGNAEMEKDGTATYYDLWPGNKKGVDESNFDKDETPSYHKNIVSVKDLTTKGFYENYAPDGVIEITTMGKVSDDVTKDVMDKLIAEKLPYNGLTNNCSDFAKSGVESATGKNIPDEEISKGIVSTTPNQLYKSTASYSNTSVLKNPGNKVNHKFIDGVTNGSQKKSNKANDRLQSNSPITNSYIKFGIYN